MALNVTSALTHFLNCPERLSWDDRRMMILLDVFLMLSIVRYSLLLREVRGKGLIENDITDILLICQCGFDGTFRPLSHFSRIFASNIVSYSTWQIHHFVIKPQKVGHPAKLPDAPLKSCFYILNSNLYPTPEDHRAAFLINADVIHQTAPQFFPEFCLLSRQIFQLVDEVRENFPRVILLLDECLQFLKSAPGILSYPYSVYASTSIWSPDFSSTTIFSS